METPTLYRLPESVSQQEISDKTVSMLGAVAVAEAFDARESNERAEQDRALLHEFADNARRAGTYLNRGHREAVQQFDAGELSTSEYDDRIMGIVNNAGFSANGPQRFEDILDRQVRKLNIQMKPAEKARELEGAVARNLGFESVEAMRISAMNQKMQVYGVKAAAKAEQRMGYQYGADFAKSVADQASMTFLAMETHKHIADELTRAEEDDSDRMSPTLFASKKAKKSDKPTLLAA